MATHATPRTLFVARGSRGHVLISAGENDKKDRNEVSQNNELFILEAVYQPLPLLLLCWRLRTQTAPCIFKSDIDVGDRRVTCPPC